jgi:hypothetical protein
MTRLSLVLAAAAATIAPALAPSPADARDGCGRGWFYNGRACVQEEYDEPRYAPRYYGGYDRPRYYGPPPSPYNPPRPVMGANGQISCNNPNYTWQDGACKPYRGPR